METFMFTGKVFCGNDSLNILNSVVNDRVLIVTDKSMVQFGYVERISKLISAKGIDYKVFDGVLPDPSTEVISEGIKCYESAMPKVVIAIGGGSVIDAAKGIMYFKSEVDSANWCRPLFIAIPTTSGTGSECTAFAVITTATGKICIVEDWLVPDYAILDETFTLGVPDKITYDTGLDVLTHSLEAMVSTSATVFTDALASSATKLVFENLPKLKLNLKDESARRNMHIASCMAGIAFSQAGLGLNHSLAHALGGTFHIPHGRANTVLLETIYTYNLGNTNLDSKNYAAKKYAELAESIGLTARTVREGVMNLKSKITELKHELGVPCNISELGVSEELLLEHLEDMAQNAIHDRCTPTAPRQPTIEDIKMLYKTAYHSKY